LISFFRRLRAAWYDIVSRETDPSRRYWTKRALRHGERAVLNLGHKHEEEAAVTAAQKESLLPMLRSRLRGDEKIVLDYGCGPGRFTAALAETIHGRAIGVDPI
jgi:SAM-dependent methyltransferase